MRWLERGIRRAQTSLDYVARFGPAAGPATILRIGWARLRRRPFIDVSIPGTARRVRLRMHDYCDYRVFTDIFVDECYRLDGMRQAERAFDTAGRETLIVDCGANNGCSALWYALRYPAATVVAIEPEAENYALMCANVAGCANVETIRAAVWDCETELAIVPQGKAGAWAFQTHPLEHRSGADDRTPTVTLDAILARYPSAERILVKIDIEGAEGTVFAATSAWLDRVDVLVVELHDWMLPWQGTSRSVLSRTMRLPMDVLFAGENAIFFRDRSRQPALEAAQRL